MTDILKGNFSTKSEVKKPDSEETDSLENRFEREALKKLGGSIAFVRKQKVKWSEDE